MKQAQSNTVHSEQTQEYKAILKDNGDDTVSVISQDASEEEIFMGKLDTTLGDVVEEAGSMSLKREDLAGHEAKFREVSMCVDGTPMLARFVKTENYPPV